MRKTKVEKGITLVALIITIIVLLILAVVAINAVQNDGIMEYAKNARTEYEKAQEDEQSELDKYLSQIETTKGIHNGTILKGGSYTRGEQILGEGEKFPETPVEGDIYVYGHYKYTYYNKYSTINEKWPDTAADNMNGWRVQVLENGRTEYGEILTTINGANIKSLVTTFLNCSKLKKAPIIPSTVVDMRGTFQGCLELSDMPVLPEGLMDLHTAFSLCEKLQNATYIPDSVTNLFQTFYGCTSLKTIKNLPKNLENAYATFYNCTSLKNLNGVIIPAKVNNLRSTFDHCTELEGEVVIITNQIDTSDLEKYKNCFYWTNKAITLKGIDSDGNNEYDNIEILNTLAGTANRSNVKVHKLTSN